jgi:hypothetical protein
MGVDLLHHLGLKGPHSDCVAQARRMARKRGAPRPGAYNRKGSHSDLLPPLEAVGGHPAGPE